MDPNQPGGSSSGPVPSFQPPTSGAAATVEAVSVPRRRSRWPWVLALLVIGPMIAIFCFSMMLNRVLMSSAGEDAQIREKKVEHPGTVATADGKIAVITISGAILSPEGYVKQQIDQVRKDENVKAVVLRINSPGGTVTASDYLYHHLLKLKEERDIPIVVSMGSICASGGYYIAMAVDGQSDTVFAEPTTWTGSIGVIIPHYDISGLLEEYDIKNDSIASHPLKQLGSSTKKMSDEERKILQEMVNISFDGFKEIVLKGRPGIDNKTKDDDGLTALDRVATGQVFTASQAKENGLIDEIGFIEKAIDRAIKLANVDPSDVYVVKYRRPQTLLGSILGASARARPIDAEALLDLATPRAYYLFSAFPALVNNGAQ
jgi:protease-4